MIDRMRQRAIQAWQTLLHLNDSPGQIAAGFSIGIFVNLLPILPFSSVTAVGLCWLLRKNLAAALVGSGLMFLLAPVFPLILLAEYRLGRRFVAVERVEHLDRAHLGQILHMGRDAYAATLVGALLLAIPVSLVIYGVVKRVVARRSGRKE